MALQIALVAAVAVTIAAAWFARQNVFEWMYHPATDIARHIF